MAINMSFDEYKRELELQIKHNPAECDLYPIIWCLLMSCKNMKNYSLRCTVKDVRPSKTVDTSSRLYSYVENGKKIFGSLDYVVFPTGASFKNKADAVGAVEVKRTFIPLNIQIKKDEPQYNYGLEKFKTVLYTNGLEWRVYKKGCVQPVPTVILGTYTDKNGQPIEKERKVKSDNKIMWNSKKNWLALKKMLNDIDWGVII